MSGDARLEFMCSDDDDNDLRNWCQVEAGEGVKMTAGLN